MEELIKTESTEVLAFAGYKDFEAAADRTANKIKEGFMEMGYILKMARDTDILQDSEYTDYQDFAKRRYQLDPGTVSRYIRIVQNFSVDGNSHVLKEQYKDFGFAKLTIMLSIPEAINEALTPNLSKTEIQAIKDEVDAENQVSDIEIEIEKAEAAAATDRPVLPPEGAPLRRNLWQLGKEQEELFRKLWTICNTDMHPRNTYIMDALIPQGDAVYTVRIPGERRTQIIINSDGATLINMKTMERHKYAPQEICLEVDDLFLGGSSPEEWYEQMYGMKMSNGTATTEKNTEVAPVQPNQKKETRKESKVIKAKPEKNKPQEPEKKPEQMTIPGAEPDPVPEEPETQVNDSCSGDSASDNQDTDIMVTEEQVPGQTDLESDFPQYLPDAEKRTAYLQSICGAVDNLVRYAEMDLIGAARQQVSDISGYLDKLEELSKGGGQDAETIETGESEGV